MTSTHALRRTAGAVGAAALAALALAGGAHAADRAPIRDCGDISMNVSAITAQGASCSLARRIATAVPRNRTCTSREFCTVRAYNCLLGPVGKELTLVRCENATQTRFVRFEFGA